MDKNLATRLSRRIRSQAATLLLTSCTIGLLAACTVTLAAPTAGSSTANDGYLEGHASIGPLTPVERVGVPTPTPSPAVCTSRGLIILAGDGKTEVTNFNLQSDCTYRVALKPGTYVVQLKPGGGFSRDLPKTVQIQSGQTTRLDLTIDTGIR